MGHTLDRAEFLGLDGALPIDRLAQGVDDPAQHTVTHRDLHDTSRGLDNISLIDVLLAAQEHRADVVLLQVQHHAVDLSRELQELALHGVVQSMDTGNAVRHLNDRSNIRDRKL